MRILLKLYRISTYIFDLLLIIGLCFSIYEYFIKNMNYNWTNIPVNLFIIYLLVTSSYFVHKTSRFYTLNSSLEIENFKEKVNFKFDKYVGISNSVFGIILLLSSLYALLFYKIGEVSYQRIFRLISLFLFIFYAVLKIFYARRILIIIKNKP